MNTGVMKQAVESFIDLYPDMSDNWYAKALVERGIYDNRETARDAVRRVRGVHGNGSRKQCTRPKAEGEGERRRKNPFGLPSPAPTWYREFELPSDVGKWLVLNDVHIPFQSNAALESCFEFALTQNIDGILLNGDISDQNYLSPFGFDPRSPNYIKELDALKQFFDVLESEFSPKKIIWKYGNHEYRFQRYLYSKSPELLELAEYGFEGYLGLAERGIQAVKRGCPITHGKLTILHGDEFGRSMMSPVNPARGAFMRAKDCCIVGHEHRTSQHTETTVRGNDITTWSIGCLCDLNPAYRPKNGWNWGFGILDAGKDWRFHNFRIDGKTKEVRSA